MKFVDIDKFPGIPLPDTKGRVGLRPGSAAYRMRILVERDDLGSKNY
jgi:hypothetical protein